MQLVYDLISQLITGSKTTVADVEAELVALANTMQGLASNTTTPAEALITTGIFDSVEILSVVSTFEIASRMPSEMPSQ